VDADERERAFWQRHAKGYDRTLLKLFGRPIPRVLALVGEAVSGAGTVLEVAAGTGVLTLAIAPRVERVVATDYSDEMLGVLRAKVREAGLSNVESAQADIYSLPYPAESFDAVVAGNVLHLVPDLPSAIQSLLRVLRVGGKLLVPTFCHDDTLTARVVSRVFALAGQPMHRRFTTASLRNAVERHGARVVRAESVPGLIPIGYVEAVVDPRPRG
jgi:ubiquinone/menaquinone biosynthesis C-methylase UbiE